MVVSPFHPEIVPEVPIHHVAFAEFAKHSDKEALIDATTGKTYTYQQLLVNIKHFACGLHKLGVKKGDVIAIFSPNHLDYPVWVYGALSVGALITTANPTYTKYELNYHLKDSTASCVIACPSIVHLVQEVSKDLKGQIKHVIAEAPGCVSPSSLLTTDTEATWPVILTTPVASDQVAILPYSSGTTGLPKGVMLTHRNILANSMQMSHPGMMPPPELMPDEQPVYLGLVPFYHAYGLVGIQFLGLIMGAKIIVLDKFKPRTFLAAIEKYKIQHLLLVPSLVVFLTKSELVKEYDISSVVGVNSGAAPLSAEADAELREKCPHVMFMRQGYGMTETTLGAASHSIVREIKPGSVGNLVSGTEGKIVDVGTGSLMGPYERGELCIRGPQIMKGYWNKPEATRETIDEFGYLHTGDIAYYDNDGYFFIVDRIKELIKCKGLQVAPAELEAILLTHPLVADAGVTGIPHPTAGEVPRAYVVLKPGKSVTADQLKKFVADKVSDYKKLEGGLIFLDEIPRSPSGKILRRKLKEMAKSSKL